MLIDIFQAKNVEWVQGEGFLAQEFTSACVILE